MLASNTKNPGTDAGVFRSGPSTANTNRGVELDSGVLSSKIAWLDCPL